MEIAFCVFQITMLQHQQPTPAALEPQRAGEHVSCLTSAKTNLMRQATSTV